MFFDFICRIAATMQPSAPVLLAAAPVSPAVSLTADDLIHLGVRAEDASDWCRALLAAFPASHIDTPQRVSGFLANTLHETGGFRNLSENLNYASDKVRNTFSSSRFSDADVQRFCRRPGQVADQQGIANCVYGGHFGVVQLGNTQPGDGWRFRGRGLIQLTGRANYTRFSASVGLSVDDLVIALGTKEGAARVAAVWWDKKGCNSYMDADYLEGARRIVNGGSLGMEHVQQLYDQAMDLLS